MLANPICIYFLVTKRSKTNKASIKCRITYNKQRFSFSTGIYIDTINWSPKEQKVLTAEPLVDSYNTELLLMKQKIYNTYLKLKFNDEKFTIGELKQRLQITKSNDEFLLSHYQNYLDEQKKLIGISIKEATWYKFYYTRESVQSFILYKYKTKEVRFDVLNVNFLDELDYYLKTVRNQRQVTINKEIQRFRAVIKLALARNLIDKDPFILYKPKRTIKEVIFLTMEELNRFKDSKPTKNSQILVRDLFIFCCYSGLPYGEMANLKEQNLSKGFDDNIWITIKRAKTSKELVVPLFPEAEVIINKYRYSTTSDKIFPPLSNQKFNQYLKDIAVTAKIDKRVTHHTARKTFASTILLYNDVPMEIVSELLGHSSMKITQDYYGKIIRKKVSQEYNKLQQRMNADTKKNR